MSEKSTKYLHRINSPEELKQLTQSELKSYGEELREYIISELSSNPGHLGSSLGVVELSIALHYVLQTPEDKLIWDVGHQAYAHKIITGRREAFPTNRKLGGLSGFPKMSESPYDAFGGGHASTSISAALGMAVATSLKGERRHVVAVIGDGAMSGGLAFEGLNNAGDQNSDLLVILNDNRMAIDPNVGALKSYLLRITTSRRYNWFKGQTWMHLRRFPRLRRAIQKLGNALKQGLLQQSNLFESLNFRYFGPIDGHDIDQLVRVLRDLHEIPGPKLLHVLTQKGKGYTPAEQNQKQWHAPGCFNPETGERIVRSKASEPPLFQEVFGHTLLELAQQNEQIVGITPAMPSGCSLSIVMEQMPERCFDVGIAEGHAVTFSAGLAAQGMIPFCNIYSSFFQRAYDNWIHDVALQGLDVVLCLDRAGLVGEDGATHHGLYDLSALLPIPGLTIASPRNEVELRNLMYTASLGRGAFVIRYPRGAGSMVQWREPLKELAIARSEVLQEGKEIALLSFGAIATEAQTAVERLQKEGISVLHVDLRYAKPLDTQMLDHIGREFSRVVTVEDGAVIGGVGSAVESYLHGQGYTCRVIKLGVPDEFIAQGTPAELKALCGYDSEGIYRTLTQHLQKS